MEEAGLDPNWRVLRGPGGGRAENPGPMPGRTGTLP